MTETWIEIVKYLEDQNLLILLSQCEVACDELVYHKASYARVTMNLCQIHKNYPRFQYEVTQHEKEAHACSETTKNQKNMFKKQL